MSDPRFDAVAAVLQEYFDGLCHSDTQRLRRVFHPQAVYACATAEPAVILRMEEYFPIVDQRPSPASIPLLDGALFLIASSACQISARAQFG